MVFWLVLELAICNDLLYLFLGMALSAFSGAVWQYYAANGVQLMGQSKYGLVRSLLSKCVAPHETAKVFSALAISMAVMPMAGNPTFRKLYNFTLDTFTGAFIILAASILALSAFLNFVVFTQRWRIDQTTQEKNPEKVPTVAETIDVSKF